MRGKDGDELLPIAEAARILGISIVTLRRWDRSGKFPADLRTLGKSRRYSRKRLEVWRSEGGRHD
ncbi:MerR family DNA-binding transcriptional regulator [Acidithiobacillus caldus]